MIKTLQRVWVPVITLVWFGFSEYAYCYLFCKRKLYDDLHHESTAIGLIVGTNIAMILICINWITLLIKGPGKLPLKVPPYNLNRYYKNGELFQKGVLDANDPAIDDSLTNFVDPPDFFQCNWQGLPYWCSHCESIKVLRSHHFSRLNICCPYMDHYCAYLGSLIGYDNYPYFVGVVICYEMWFLIVLVSLCCFASRIEDFSKRRILHPADIVTIIISGFWLVTVTVLFGSVLNMVAINELSIERLNMKRCNALKSKLGAMEQKPSFKTRFLLRKNQLSKTELQRYIDSYQRYMNVKHPQFSNVRVVIPLRDSDHPFNKGLFENLKQWCFRFPKFATPQDVVRYECDMISMSFKKKIQERIKDGEGHVFGSLSVTPVDYQSV